MSGVTIAEPDLFECIGSQRAMRRLKPDPVPDDYIKKILWAATRAPNGGNVQPWRFLVLTDPETRTRMAEIYAGEWAKYTANSAASAPAYDPGTRTVSSGQYLADHMAEVPVLIVACGFLLPVNSGIASGSSIYPAIQNLMLAARALGLGSALTTLHRHNESAVRELLGIPENAHVAAVIPVGWPRGKFGAGPRKPVEEVTYWNHWGEKRP